MKIDDLMRKYQSEGCDERTAFLRVRDTARFRYGFVYPGSNRHPECRKLRDMAPTYEVTR